MTDSLPQAIIRIVPGGGARTAEQIQNQWRYLTRKGHMQLRRSERHLGVVLSPDQVEAVAESWAQETGYGQTGRDLTTHIVISFPPGTDEEKAFAIARAWAEEMFGSGRNGGSFDYLTACHTDRAHPHMHLIVNRRAFEGHWLKISRRHHYLSYDRLRLALAEIAGRHGVALEATSRLARGIAEAPITYAEYRRRARKSAALAAERPPEAEGSSHHVS